MAMKFKSYTLIILFSFFVLLSCNTKKRMVQTTKVDQTESIIVKKDSTRTKKTDVSLQVTDTTKRKDNNITITKAVTTETQYDDQGQRTSEKKTEYTKTTLYISEEDKFLFENGYLKDSSEVKRADDLHLHEKDEMNQKTKDFERKYDKIAKTIAISLFSLIAFLVCGYIIYKKIRDTYK